MGIPRNARGVKQFAKLPLGRRGPRLEETRQDYAIRSSVAITKLPLGRAILKKKRKNKEMRFFENIFSLDFLTFWLSYSTYSITTGSGTQQVNFMEKFQVFHFVLAL